MVLACRGCCTPCQLGGHYRGWRTARQANMSGLQEVLETMTDEQQDELDLMQRNPRIYQDLARSIAPQVRELQVLVLMLWSEYVLSEHDRTRLAAYPTVLGCVHDSWCILCVHPGRAECSLQQCATDESVACRTSKAFQVAQVMFVDCILQMCRPAAYDAADRQQSCICWCVAAKPGVYAFVGRML